MLAAASLPQMRQACHPPESTFKEESLKGIPVQRLESEIMRDLLVWVLEGRDPTPRAPSTLLEDIFWGPRVRHVHFPGLEICLA